MSDVLRGRAEARCSTCRTRNPPDLMADWCRKVFNDKTNWLLLSPDRRGDDDPDLRRQATQLIAPEAIDRKQ